ncbi:hypothetical protein ES703_92127 [subsurface metagenome]
MVEDQVRDHLRLPDVVPPAAPVVDAVLHVDELKPQVLGPHPRCREEDETPVVEPVIAEADEGVVLAPVVPPEHLHREPYGHALIQDAVEDVELVLILIPVKVLVHRVPEEGGRGQLLRIPSHHKLASPVDGAHGVLAVDLGGLVEDHEVEVKPPRD